MVTPSPPSCVSGGTAAAAELEAGGKGNSSGVSTTSPCTLCPVCLPVDALSPVCDCVGWCHPHHPHPHHQVKLYDLANLSLKFDRHLDAEVVDFQVCVVVCVDWLVGWGLQHIHTQGETLCMTPLTTCSASSTTLTLRHTPPRPRTPSTDPE